MFGILTSSSVLAGEQLLLGLAHFSNSLYTLFEKTIEDNRFSMDYPNVLNGEGLFKQNNDS